MTYLELIQYLEENVGVELQIMFRNFEGPNLPKAVYQRIQKDRLNDILGYVQPREMDALDEMVIIYLLNKSNINVLEKLIIEYIGIDNNWKHPEIVNSDVSITLQNLNKPFDIAYQVIKIKFQMEAHLKSVVIEKLQKIGNVNLMNEDDFDYENGFEKNIGNNLLILLKKNEDKGQVQLRFIAKGSFNIDDAIGYFETVTQHLMRRIQNNSVKETDFLNYKGVDYSYRII